MKMIVTFEIETPDAAEPPTVPVVGSVGVLLARRQAAPPPQWPEAWDGRIVDLDVVHVDDDPRDPAAHVGHRVALRTEEGAVTVYCADCATTLRMEESS